MGKYMIYNNNNHIMKDEFHHNGQHISQKKITISVGFRRRTASIKICKEANIKHISAPVQKKCRPSNRCMSCYYEEH